MKKLMLLSAALAFVTYSAPVSAETTIPTTPDGAKGVCKTGATSCSMVPCGSTYCSAHCPNPSDCYVIVFMKKPKPGHPIVTAKRQ